MEDLILNGISLEIERKYNCKVLDIRYAELLSLCVMFKVQFKDDCLYKPFKELPTPTTICFSEKSATFYKRVDLFDFVKQNSLN